MKVLHLVSGELSGGAARGAYWLHTAQCKMGVDSTMLITGRDTLGDRTVISLTDNRAQRLNYALRIQLADLPLKLYRDRCSDLYHTGFDGLKFYKHPAYEEADIIHLHWINSLVSISGLAAIAKPVVWTMRDMWPLTGGCHYSMECERYLVGCGMCPNLGSSNLHDLSRLVVARKKKSLPKNIHVVGISNWISECARRSEVFRGCNVSTISNAIDTEQFYPVEPQWAREILNLPHDKKIVLVGAKDVDDFYKGLIFLLSQCDL